MLASSSAFATIGVDPTSLGTGIYNGIISVTQAGAANSPVSVPVVLVVNGGGSGGGTGTLTFSPSHDFTLFHQRFCARHFTGRKRQQLYFVRRDHHQL